MHLLIDTSQNITIGLLDGNFTWVEYQYLISKKSSADLHYLIYETLKKHDLDVTNIESLFYCAGPGSYTGMRISEGLSNIFEWSKIKVNSFYHFQVPYFCGVESGVWISKAFKGEYFLARWNKDKIEKSLLDLDSILNESVGENVFFGHESLPELEGKYSKELIKNQPEKLFSYILKHNLKQELYYYRPLEEEFTRKNE